MSNDHSVQNYTFNDKPVAYNYTLWYNPVLCTIDTCPKSYATMLYIPSLGANSFFLAWFTILFVAQAVIGSYKRTWSYVIAMVGGCLTEMAGYGARISMHANIFDENRFLA